MKKKARTFPVNDTPHNNCPCCSGMHIESCCAPIIQNQALAKTPEELMRSRYTAYVLQKSDYILQSWDISYRPESITFDNDVQWIHLEITESELKTGDENTGYVNYCATSICDDILIKMREKSTFVNKKGLWFYQQGQLKINRDKISLNSNCPCGSKKKYKRCCRLSSPNSSAPINF